jgi:iron(III) transport system substrate-binding protein
MRFFGKYRVVIPAKAGISNRSPHAARKRGDSRFRGNDGTGDIVKRVLLTCAVLLAVGCAQENAVVIYSPHGADILKDYENLFEAQYPEIDMQWLDMGSRHVYNRVYSERNRPACDIWWGAPSTMFMQAAEIGLLAEYTPTWVEAVDASSRGANDTWLGTHDTPLCIMFNDKGYARDEVPQTWDDLLDPKWKGKIVIRKPLESGTMRTFIGAMVSRADDDDAGIEWLKRLHASTVSYPENPQLLFDRIKRNQDEITVWIVPDAVLQKNRHGYPFDYYVPEQTAVLTEGIAIVEGAPHADAARKFYEFVTTQEALIHQAEAYGKIPARTDIEASQLPDWMNEQPIVPMSIDWTEFSTKNEEWCERWDSEVYGAR